MTQQRGLAIACGLLLAGGSMLLLAAGRVWGDGESAGALAGADELLGRDVAPVTSAVGLVALAGIAGLLATRGWVRACVGVVLAAAGLAVVVPVVGAAADERQTIWPWVALLGALLVIGAGTWAAARGRRWPALGRRYAAEPRTAVRSDDPWTALDRGQDPTA